MSPLRPPSQGPASFERRLKMRETVRLENPSISLHQKPKEITYSPKPGVTLEICNFLIPSSLISPRSKITDLRTRPKLPVSAASSTGRCSTIQRID